MIQKKLFVLSLLILAIGASACSPAATEASVNKTSTAVVTRGDLQIGLTADGRVALPVTNLDFGVDGTIKTIYVSTGDMVKAGDLLADLDDTDYQLEITNAQNNLEKAMVAYDDAVNQYNYSLKSNEYNLESTKNQLTKAFDSYSYQNSILDAENTLRKRQEELAEAEANALVPFDDYSYQIKILDAEANLATKKAELEETKASAEDPYDDYSEQISIAEAKTNLSRKQDALKEAEAELKTAKSARGDEFDSSSYQRNVDNAQSAYNKALDAYNTAAYAFMSVPADEQDVALYDAVLKAQSDMEDAQKALDNAQSDMEKAQSNYNDTLKEQLQKNIDTAQAKVDSAQQAVADAEWTLEKAENNLARNADSAVDKSNSSISAASEAVTKAETDLERAKTDMERARKQAAEDANTKVKNAKTAVTEAETSLSRAKTNLERALKDYNDQLKSTQNTYELQTMNLENQKNSTSSISNAQLNIEDAKLKLQEAENKLDKTKVYAPKDGQIINITLSEGEQAKANSSQPNMIFGTSGSSNSFMTLCDVSQIYLTASISEGDIVGLSVGQVLRVTIDSIGDVNFPGTVTYISNIPTTDMSSGITTYTVTGKLDEPNTDIRDGMNALINFIKMERLDVLMIPNKAVFIENNKQYVHVQLADGTYEKREVVCALSNGTQTEVSSGLSEGEIVAVGSVK